MSYSDHEQDYNQTLSRVRSFLSSNARSTTTLRECERLLAYARDVAATLEELALAEGDTLRIADSQRRVDRDITPLLEEVHRAMKEKDSTSVNVNVEETRRDLFAGAYEAPNLNENGTTSGEGDMEMFIQESEQLLLNSQSLCAESEQIGTETLNTMGLQREQLHRTHDRLRGANAYLEQASVILRDMHRKVFRNKIFLYAVIAILMLANVVVIITIIVRAFKKLFKGHHNDDDDDQGNANEDDGYYKPSWM